MAKLKTHNVMCFLALDYRSLGSARRIYSTLRQPNQFQMNSFSNPWSVLESTLIHTEEHSNKWLPWGQATMLTSDFTEIHSRSPALQMLILEIKGKAVLQQGNARPHLRSHHSSPPLLFFSDRLFALIFSTVPSLCRSNRWRNFAETHYPGKIMSLGAILPPPLPLLQLGRRYRSQLHSDSKTNIADT